MEKYTCCQGYFNCLCCKGGNFCEGSCPSLCLCGEAFFCCCCSMQATRFLVMDTLMVIPDPCDNRLMRCQNCIQLCACFFQCVGCLAKIIGLPGADQCTALCVPHRRPATPPSALLPLLSPLPLAARSGCIC